MNILHGDALAKEIRDICDAATRRLWIAVPYLGSLSTVRKHVGRAWIDKDDLDTRLMVDLDDRALLDLRTLQEFARRGKISSLPGLHAKVFLADDAAVVGSANLTEWAFRRRYEVGVRLRGTDVQQLANLYTDWWDKKAQPKTLDEIRALKPVSKPGRQRGPDDHGRPGLPVLWTDLDDPGGGEQGASVFADYVPFLGHYEKLATEYSAVQRVWPNAPRYIEVDEFLEYLFHGSTKPSKPYHDRGITPRKLTDGQRVMEIRRWARRFAADVSVPSEHEGLNKKLKHIRSVQRLLAVDMVSQVEREDVKEVVFCINAQTSDARNRTKFLKPENNSLSTIRVAWRDLIHGEGSIVDRMTRCNGRLTGFGKSSIQELVGYYWPDRYPLRNTNVNSGLRFFGFPVAVY